MNAVLKNYPCMPPRDLCIRVESIEVNVRKDPVISIPAADLRFLVAQRKFGARTSAAFDKQNRMYPGRCGRRSLDRRRILFRSVGFANGRYSHRGDRTSTKTRAAHRPGDWFAGLVDLSWNGSEPIAALFTKPSAVTILLSAIRTMFHRVKTWARSYAKHYSYTINSGLRVAQASCKEKVHKLFPGRQGTSRRQIQIFETNPFGWSYKPLDANLTGLLP